MKIERIISIIMILIEKKMTTAKELAQTFEVSKRTIYRDIDVISMAGIPIITYPGTNGGIGIIENYKIEKSLFSREDIINIISGINNVFKSLSDNEINYTLVKMKSIIPKNELKQLEFKANQISIDFSIWTGNKFLKEKLDIIKSAMNRNLKFFIIYKDGQGKEMERKISPYQLILKESNWYLHGFCDCRNDFRVFKLSRISSIKIINEEFTVIDFNPTPLTDISWIESRLIEIRVIIDKSILEFFIDRCREDSIEFLDNEKIILTFPFAPDELGYRFLLSFGEKCMVIEPKFVIEEIKNKIKNTLNLYK